MFSKKLKTIHQTAEMDPAVRLHESMNLVDDEVPDLFKCVFSFCIT